MKNNMDNPGRGRRPSYQLTGADIVEHLHTQQELVHQTRNYFHFSKLWRAIREHIANNGLGKPYGSYTDQRQHDINKVVLIDPPFDWVENEDSYLGVKCYRGSGYAVSFKDAAIYGSPDQDSPNPAKNLHLTFEVEWESNFESFTRTYTIKVPLDLCKVEDDFIEEAFDNWIMVLQQDKEKAQREKDAATFRDLIKRYPALSAAECQRALDKILRDED